jgi:hypothetical protein
MCMLSLFYQLPNCNLFTQHVIYLYGETPLVNCGPRSILLHCYYRLPFTRIIYFLANYYLLPHDTFNPLFIANQWDWQPHCKFRQSTLVVLCAGSTLLLVQSYATDKAPYINYLELSPSQRASTFESWFFLILVRYTSVSYWGKTCCCAHHTFLLGFPRGCLTRTIKQFFWRRCRGERGFLQGESLASNLFTLLLFCFTLFLLASFYKKYKKISSFYSWYFVTFTFCSLCCFLSTL